MKHADLVKPSLLALLTLLLFSCSLSRHQDGFTYKPAYSAPDFGSGEDVVVNENAGNEIAVLPPANDHKFQLNEDQKDELQTIVSIGLAEEKKDQDFKTVVRKMAVSYGEKNNEEYSEKQLKKLDRISTRLEKMKLQKEGGPDVSWGPSNNLEWAILGAAAVGLFVGIFGVGFGWFVFLVAALAYLFIKLLHKN